MLFIKLTGGTFLQRQFFFLIYRVGFPNCECGYLLNKSSLCCY